MKLFISSIFFFVLTISAAGQNKAATNIPDSALQISKGKREPPLPNFKKRQWIAGGISLAGYAGSLAALDKAWYRKYPKSPFHTFNDFGEWLQIDKTGHAWTAYNSSRLLTALWHWAGVPENKAVWAGSLSGFSYLMIIEILDAHSAEWGWSWGDVAANVAGSALFAVQQIGWKEQRIQFKFSAHPKNYQGVLQERADQLFGSSLPEKLLKDYNAQTYWLSVNLKSFIPQSSIPSWLNVSVGYGADGMFGGYENIAFDKNGRLIFHRPDIKRYRQWYLSPDIDLTKINTSSKLLKTVFATFNSLKIPAPSLEFSKGKLRGRLLSF